MTVDTGQAVRYGAALVVSFGAAWALTPLVGRFARAHGYTDEPGGHSTHASSTPTLGGLAIAAVFVIVGLVVGGADGQLVTIVGGAVALGFIGALDDRRSVSPWVRMGAEGLAAVALWVVGVRAGLLGEVWFDLPLTILWVVAVVNAFNMIDNHDGIAALVAALSTLGIGLIAGASGFYLVAGFALAVTGACLGFFVHNKPPATIFLGDAGSMFLGFLVASLALKVDLPEGSWVVRLAVALLIVAVPLFDESLVVLARLRERRPLMQGATDHTAHRLRAAGWSKRGVVIAIGAAQAACSLAAFGVAQVATDAAALAALVGIAACWLAGLTWFLVRMPTTARETDAAVVLPGGAVAAK